MVTYVNFLKKILWGLTFFQGIVLKTIFLNKEINMPLDDASKGLKLTGIFWIHMGRVEPKLDEDGDRHSKLEPLHHVWRGLARQRMDHVASQDHALPSASRHKLGFLP